MILSLPVQLPDQSEIVLPLSPTRHPSRFSLHESVLWFDLPRGEDAFLASDDNHLPALRPGRLYRASWSSMIHGGQAALSWTEFDRKQQIAHWSADIHQGHQEHTFRTHPDHRQFRLALQLRGAGHLWLQKVRLDFGGDPD